MLIANVLEVIEMEKKKKFNQIWSNQTNLGKKFRLSAIAIGKLLIDNGLKDKKLKWQLRKQLMKDMQRIPP